MSYPLTTSSWDWREILAIAKVVKSGRYTMGEQVKQFEKEFAKKMECNHAIMVNSGSSANLVGLAAWMKTYNIPVGSEIIVPAVGWSTSYFPISQLGLIPVFVDVDPVTFNIDTSLIEKAITKKTQAILAINLLGMPCDFGTLETIGSKHGLYILEDNCESLGAKWDKMYTGTGTTFGTNSFFFSHHIQTMEGGMICTDDDILADYCRAIRAHGWIRDLQFQNTIDHDPNRILLDADALRVAKWKEQFRFIVPGYCVRPLEMSGAIGREQLKKLDKFVEVRRRNARTFRHEFGGWKNWIIQKEAWPEAESSWYGFAVVTGSEAERNKIVHLLSTVGVETRPIVTGNFLNQPVMDQIKHRKVGSFDVAERIDKCGFMFGNSHIDLRDNISMVFRLVETMK